MNLNMIGFVINVRINIAFLYFMHTIKILIIQTQGPKGSLITSLDIYGNLMWALYTPCQTEIQSGPSQKAKLECYKFS